MSRGTPEHEYRGALGEKAQITLIMVTVTKIHENFQSCLFYIMYRYTIWDLNCAGTHFIWNLGDIVKPKIISRASAIWTVQAEPSSYTTKNPKYTVQ